MLLKPAIRFYLHSVARRDGQRVLYVSVSLGNGHIPVRLSTGYTVHPAHFSPQAPYLLAVAPNGHLLNEKLAALSLALVQDY